MEVSMIVWWAIVGICPDWWPPPRRWPPRPRPGPWWYLVEILGGIAGGFIYDRAFGPASADAAAIYPAATAVGALVGSVILQRIVEPFAGGARDVVQDERVG